ncbi:MAG: beta-N-acetylhexosaminidase, partial [Bacilli bacterium]|nr:beta-N-acetylhexosaminidase [Bacilli bacterium]
MRDIYQMTKEEKLGQLVWVGFHGYEFNDDLKYLIDKYKVGNIILFTRNIKDIKQLFNLNKQIHEYVLEKTGVMPFISID